MHFCTSAPFWSWMIIRMNHGLYICSGVVVNCVHHFLSLGHVAVKLDPEWTVQNAPIEPALGVRAESKHAFNLHTEYWSRPLSPISKVWFVWPLSCETSFIIPCPSTAKFSIWASFRGSCWITLLISILNTDRWPFIPSWKCDFFCLYLVKPASSYLVRPPFGEISTWSKFLWCVALCGNPCFLVVLAISRAKSCALRLLKDSMQHLKVFRSFYD